MFKKILLVAAMLNPMLASAQTLKIGLVDFQEIISKMPEAADADKQVSETSKKYEEEFSKLQDEMKRKVEDYQNMSQDELPAIKERKARELQDYQTKIEQFSQNAMQDLQQMQAQLMQPIYQKVRTAVDAVGKEGSFSLIQMYDQSLTLFYASPVVNITDDVKAKLGIK